MTATALATPPSSAASPAAGASTTTLLEYGTAVMVIAGVLGVGGVLFSKGPAPISAKVLGAVGIVGASLLGVLLGQQTSAAAPAATTTGGINGINVGPLPVPPLSGRGRLAVTRARLR